MRYTPYRGLPAVTAWIKLKFAALNLKKLALHRWRLSPAFFRFFFPLHYLKPPHAFAGVTSLTGWGALQNAGELFYQYVRQLEDQEETVLLDGTKMESRAGRYTFCWRKTVEKQLVKVKRKVQEATGLETLEALAQYVQESKAGIVFVHGKGQRKSQAQREWEAAEECRRCWEMYEQDLSIMGSGRNSYSTTDLDATFMRMKNDHMRNDQLKTGYNVQIAVNSKYITGVDVFHDRTDFGTLIPFMKQMEKKHGVRYREVVADAGYKSLHNVLFLESSGQLCFVKPANYDAQ